MFALCDAMKWAHLPVEGGLFAQDPAFIDACELIFSERAKEEARQHELQKREQEKQKRQQGSGRRFRR